MLFDLFKFYLIDSVIWGFGHMRLCFMVLGHLSWILIPNPPFSFAVQLLFLIHRSRNRNYYHTDSPKHILSLLVIPPFQIRPSGFDHWRFRSGIHQKNPFTAEPLPYRLLSRLYTGSQSNIQPFSNSTFSNSALRIRPFVTRLLEIPIRKSPREPMSWSWIYVYFVYSFAVLHSYIHRSQKHYHRA